MPRPISFFFFLLVFLQIGGTQTVCPYVAPPPNAPVRHWDKAPLLLAHKMTVAPGQSATEQSDAALLQFIYHNLRWPAVAHCVEGTIVIAFVIDTDGKVERESIRCVRSIHPALEEESIRIIERMVDLQMRWQPAEKDGEQVRAQYFVPIRWKLE